MFARLEARRDGLERWALGEALDQLAAAGILIPLSAGQRNRWWEAEGMIELIEKLEGAE